MTSSNRIAQIVLARAKEIAMSNHDPDAQRFRDYAEGHSNDSPVGLCQALESAPRCGECGRAIDEDEGCQDVDCLAGRADEAATIVNTLGAMDECRHLIQNMDEGICTDCGRDFN